MKKSNYTFEVHAYAPELNKIYLIIMIEYNDYL